MTTYDYGEYMFNVLFLHGEHLLKSGRSHIEQSDAKAKAGLMQSDYYLGLGDLLAGGVMIAAGLEAGLNLAIEETERWPPEWRGARWRHKLDFLLRVRYNTDPPAPEEITARVGQAFGLRNRIVHMSPGIPTQSIDDDFDQDQRKWIEARQRARNAIISEFKFDLVSNHLDELSDDLVWITGRSPSWVAEMKKSSEEKDERLDSLE